MKKTGMMVSSMMQSFFTIITLLRKATEYAISTLLTSKKLKIKNTALILHKALNTIFLSQITITMTQNQSSTRNSKICILTPTPSIKDIHTWYGRGRGRARHLELHGHRLYGEKTKVIGKLTREKTKSVSTSMWSSSYLIYISHFIHNERCQDLREFHYTSYLCNSRLYGKKSTFGKRHMRNCRTFKLHLMIMFI